LSLENALMTSSMSEIDRPTAGDKSTSSEQPQSTGIEVEQATPVKSGEQKEINGPRGLEPTRYGDWESKGRCRDF